MAGAAIPQKPQPLTPEQRDAWNGFIDYLQKTGYKGSTALDNRNMALGQNLLNRYNAMLPPEKRISYEDVARVQQELQDYRANLISKYKAGKVAADSSIKNVDTDVMPNLSPVDGWLGSKTSSYKFPTAVLTHSDGTKTNFGTNTEAYDNTISKIKK